MSILVNVVNQKMYVSSCADGLVAGSQRFVQFKFNLSSEWDGLMTFAQFQQGGKSYNEYLDEDNCVYLPAEIGVGTCTMMLYGSYDTTIGTTNYLTFKIGKNNLVSDAESTDISQSLYDQLVTTISNFIMDGGGRYGGIVFVPDVSEDGVLSWSNNSGLFNPEPVNIKGKKGDPGSSGVYIGSGEMPEDCNVQIDPNGDALSEDVVGDITEQIANIEEEIGDSKEATYLFPKVAYIDDGMYVDSILDRFEQENCKTYHYDFGDNNYPDGSENRKLHIKTYIYGDMAVYGWNELNMEEQVFTNETADIENNPESGIFECEVDLECFYPWGVSYQLDVSFCENPYMDKPEVEIKSNLWQEIEDIRNNAVTYDYLAEYYARIDDIYADLSADAELALEMAVDAQNQLQGPLSFCDAMTNYNYNEDGLATALETDEDVFCRYKKKITLTSNNQTIYISFTEPMSGKELNYFYGIVYDGNYNTRVANYTLYGDNIESAGIYITLKSDIPSGATTEVELQALFSYELMRY